MRTERSPRHQTFFCFRDEDQDDLSIDQLGEQFDLVVDQLYALCLADQLVIAALAAATTRLQGYTAMLPLLPSACRGFQWVADSASREVLRRVLYLIHPEKFGFNHTGWIH